MPKVNTVTPRGAVIQDLRERAGLSREQLGGIVGCHKQSIRRLEAISEPAGRLLVCRVARALGRALDREVNVDDLVLRAGDEEQDESSEPVADAA